MELKQFSDLVAPMTCIVSVETYPDGSYGNIRIVTGNEAYINSTKAVAELGGSDAISSKEFVPDSPYEEFVPKDKNFEDYVYRSAVLGQTLHSYVHPERFNFWIHSTMIPLAYGTENKKYCLYTQEFSKDADSDTMSSISPDVSQAVLRTCLKLHNSGDFSKTMDDVIADIRSICDSDHCCILLTDHNSRSCKVLCEAFGKDTGLLPMETYVDDRFYDMTLSWDRLISGSNCIIINSRQDLEHIKELAPEWYASLTGAGAESVVLYPLRSGDETLGYIWAINFDTDNTVRIKEALELSTLFIASEISNRQLVERLSIMSSMDLLTGLYNRNSMNSHLQRLKAADKDSGEQVSVAIADLNGLKKVNDCDGHFAGDLLLKKAAIALQRNFIGCDIYRAGGDEFVILAENAAPGQLERCAESLKSENSDDNDVSFAAGCSVNFPAHEITKAMKMADDNMYEDKKLFYKLHPEKKYNPDLI